MESRINATDRLRREGRWSEASQQRDAFRAEFKAEGYSRQEANDRAWKAMSKAFPPLSDYDIDWLPAYRFMAMAAFAPEIDDPSDSDGEPRLEAVWWLYGHCLARLARIAVSDWAGAEFVVQEMLDEDELCDEGVIDAAIAEPVYFLQTVVAEKFKNVLRRLYDAGDSNSIYVRELKSNLALIDAISRNGIESIRGVMTDRGADNGKRPAKSMGASGAGAQV